MYGYDSRVRLSETDQNWHMTLTAILNHFQDCCTFHSEDRGVGLSFLSERKRMWVLSSWNVEVERYPQMAERIRVETWPYEFGVMTGKRNFRLLDEAGRTLARADTLWVYMNAERMRPCRLDADVAAAYELEPGLEMAYAGEHIRIPANPEALEPFFIHASQLDVNHHVNNAQYVRMAADYLPEDFIIGGMRAEYKRSAVLGDELHPFCEPEEGGMTVVLGDGDRKPYAIIQFLQRESEIIEDRNI